MGMTYGLDILAGKMVGHGLCDRWLFSHTKYLGDHFGDGGLTQACFLPSFSLIQFSRHVWCKCRLTFKVDVEVFNCTLVSSGSRVAQARAKSRLHSSLFTLHFDAFHFRTPTIKLLSTLSRSNYFSQCVILPSKQGVPISLWKRKEPGLEPVTVYST